MASDHVDVRLLDNNTILDYFNRVNLPLKLLVLFYFNHSKVQFKKVKKMVEKVLQYVQVVLFITAGVENVWDWIKPPFVNLTVVCDNAVKAKRNVATFTVCFGCDVPVSSESGVRCDCGQVFCSEKCQADVKLLHLVRCTKQSGARVSVLGDIQELKLKNVLADLRLVMDSGRNPVPGPFLIRYITHEWWSKQMFTSSLALTWKWLNPLFVAIYGRHCDEKGKEFDLGDMDVKLFGKSYILKHEGCVLKAITACSADYPSCVHGGFSILDDIVGCLMWFDVMSPVPSGLREAVIECRQLLAERYCGECGQQEPLMMCGGCTVVRYCDRECQKKGWRWHRGECAIAEVTESGYQKTFAERQTWSMTAVKKSDLCACRLSQQNTLLKFYQLK